MVILTMDPSYNACAFSLYDGEDTIYIDNSSYSLGEKIGFEKIFTATHDIWRQHKEKMDSLGVGDKILIDRMISEIPPPTAQFSAGLFALDTFILSKMWETYNSIKEIMVVPSSFLGTVHNTNRYTKSDSTKLAKYFINEVFPNEFKIVIPDNVSDKGRRTKGTLNNDRAESFLFMLRAFVKYDIHGLGTKIKTEMQGLGYEGERILLSR